MLDLRGRSVRFDIDIYYLKKLDLNTRFCKARAFIVIMLDMIQ